MKNLFLAILTLVFSTSTFAVANTVKDIGKEVTNKAQSATQVVTDKAKEAVNAVTPANKDTKTPLAKEENKTGEKPQDSSKPEDKVMGTQHKIQTKMDIKKVNTTMSISMNIKLGKNPKKVALINLSI